MQSLKVRCNNTNSNKVPALTIATPKSFSLANTSVSLLTSPLAIVPGAFVAVPHAIITIPLR